MQLLALLSSLVMGISVNGMEIWWWVGFGLTDIDFIIIIYMGLVLVRLPSDICTPSLLRPRSSVKMMASCGKFHARGETRKRKLFNKKNIKLFSVMPKIKK